MYLRNEREKFSQERNGRETRRERNDAVLRFEREERRIEQRTLSLFVSPHFLLLISQTLIALFLL